MKMCTYQLKDSLLLLLMIVSHLNETSTCLSQYLNFITLFNPIKYTYYKLNSWSFPDHQNNPKRIDFSTQDTVQFAW